jgi:hypothetical protein
MASVNATVLAGSPLIGPWNSLRVCRSRDVSGAIRRPPGEPSRVSASDRSAVSSPL